MMKRYLGISMILALVALPLTAASAAPAHGFSQVSISGSVGFFYSSLSPYGEWIEIDAGYYGWRPLRVQRGWRPYLHGRWTWTDYGWYWVSYEPFGWAVFHYGRWYFDDYYGWIWIPDHVWGPAWVEWRYNDDYIGWAPLPPYASFSVTMGIRFTTRWYAPVGYWTFVPYRYFTSTTIVRHAAPADYSRRLIGVTRATSRYDIERDRVINRGVDRGYVERRGNTRIDRFDVTTSRDRGERMVRDGSRERIEVFRPDARDLEQRDRSVQIEARRPERRIPIDLERVDRSRPDMREERTGRERDAGVGRQDIERRAPERPQDDDAGRRDTRRREIQQLPSQQSDDQSRQRFTNPKERQFQSPAEQWRFERREPQREQSGSKERVSPPKVQQREPARPAPEQRRSGGGDQSRSRGQERKRDQ
jgi:hypothetical protein